MAKTNIGLVAYARAQLGLPYWYGTYVQIATEELHKSKAAQYPKYYNRKNYTQGWAHQYGARVHDCVGLIKGYLWSETPTAAPKYKGAQDFSADGMISACKTKGAIKTMPEVIGLLVHYKGHIGVYIGNGYVIEARGHNYGVVLTKLSERPWKNWGYCPFISYQSAAPAQTANKKSYFKKCDSEHTSIVDALGSIGANSSFGYRLRIAGANNLKGYVGTAKQNIELLNLLKKGKLIKP
jgi:hypothetical protein